jgi:hypothetical protein
MSAFDVNRSLQNHPELAAENFHFPLGQADDLAGTFLGLVGIVEKAEYETRYGIGMAVTGMNELHD